MARDPHDQVTIQTEHDCNAWHRSETAGTLAVARTRSLCAFQTVLKTRPAASDLKITVLKESENGNHDSGIHTGLDHEPGFIPAVTGDLAARITHPDKQD